MTWLNWDLTRQQQDLEETFSFLTKLRRENPVLRPKTFGDFNEATPEHDLLRWYNASGEIMSEADWHNSECRTISRHSERIFEDGSKNSLLLVIHGSETSITVTLPEIDGAKGFEQLWNSAHEVPSANETSLTLGSGQEVDISGTSMILFKVH
jgi:glycogen operon protein